MYLLSGASNVTLYCGVTRDLARRVYEHKAHLDPNSFSARYGTDKLVYYERLEDPIAAIEREKQIKSWNRRRKNRLVESMNPEWKNLYPGLWE